MKTISIFLALVNSLLAGLILAFSLSPTEISQAVAWWSFTKIAAACAVILVGVLTWLGSARTINPGLMSLCSLFLVALGAATIVWTFHLALVTGDMESYMVIYGGSLIAQGMSSLFGFAGDSRNITSM
jgi:Na+-translocating ferredoxin:NAD+ oxidoreductase RnfD subunit